MDASPRDRSDFVPRLTAMSRSTSGPLAPTEGLGIDDPELRARVGEDRITLFRRHGA